MQFSRVTAAMLPQDLRTCLECSQRIENGQNAVRVGSETLSYHFPCYEFLQKQQQQIAANRVSQILPTPSAPPKKDSDLNAAIAASLEESKQPKQPVRDNDYEFQLALELSREEAKRPASCELKRDAELVSPFGQDAQGIAAMAASRANAMFNRRQEQNPLQAGQSLQNRFEGDRFGALRVSSSVASSSNSFQPVPAPVPVYPQGPIFQPVPPPTAAKQAVVDERELAIAQELAAIVEEEEEKKRQAGIDADEALARRLQQELDAQPRPAPVLKEKDRFPFVVFQVREPRRSPCTATTVAISTLVTAVASVVLGFALQR